MTFARASLLNALAVAIRLGSGLAINKLLALLIGPGGYAIIGLYQNFIAILTTLSSGASTQGVTKFTAEHFDDSDLRKKLWRTSGRITITCSFFCSILCIIFRNELSRYILHNNDLWYVFIILGISLIFTSINMVLLSILNGLKEFKLFVYSNIFGSTLSLILTSTLTIFWKLPGALISLGVSQAISLLATIAFMRKQSVFQLKDLLGSIDRHTLSGLTGFIGMAIATALVAPISQILVRQWLIGRFGLDQAGLWEAMTRLSSLQLLFFSTTLSAWYLPRISEIKNQSEIGQTIKYVLIRIMPLVTICAIFGFLLRKFIIILLFDYKFIEMEKLFLFQMAGDVIKILSWIYAFVMIGRGMIQKFIFCEIIFGFLFVLLSIVLSLKFGIVGVTIAYFISYFIYFLIVKKIIQLYCNGNKANLA
jgi:PST family polysaccharide transporter